MLWILLAIITAFVVAIQDAWIKQHFSQLSSYEMAVVPMFFSFPMFAISLFFVQVRVGLSRQEADDETEDYCSRRSTQEHGSRS